jgi:hypothetical protein
MNAVPPGNPGPDDAGAAAAGIGAAASDLWRATRDRLGNTVELAAAEAELAARAGVGILILAVLAIVAILTGWVFVVVAAAALAVAAGLSWPLIAAGIALAHFVIAALLLRTAAGWSRHLTLPALRAALRGQGG